MEPIKEYAARKKAEIADYIVESHEYYSLAIIQVGDNEASNRYVANKMKDLNQVGMYGAVYKISDTVAPVKVIELIHGLNLDDSINGIIVQLPLPPAWSDKTVQQILDAISPRKDVDGLCRRNYKPQPCTPYGIYNYLVDQQVELSGKNVVVIGRSDIVGKPMARLLTDADANVTLLHSKTKRSDLEWYLRFADIVIVAVGKPHFLTADTPINPLALVIDVGINFDENGKLIGDCDKLRVQWQSPVPGGVGLLTRLQLIRNLME